MLSTVLPQIVEEKLSETRSRFTIGKLEPGYGYTIGNSLRRVLLSDIPGAAITQIAIDGALVEFQTLEGVKEDVVELVLNIKNIVVSSNSDVETLELKKETPGPVTAGDIQVPAGVEIHNPDLYFERKLNVEYHFPS